MSSHDDSPYRHDLAAAFARIAELERALAARDPAGSDPGTLRALAALRLAHLREDRDRLIARFRTRRTRIFAVTAFGMLATFIVFARAVQLQPWRAALLWSECGLAVIAVAALCAVVQSWLLGDSRASLRTIDQRRAEEAVLFREQNTATGAMTEIGGREATGLRIAVDPLLESPPDEVELLTGAAVQRTRL